MGFLDRFRTKSAGVPASGSMPTLGTIASSAGVLINQASSMTVSTVFACVSIRSEDVARCRPKLLRPLSNGARETVTAHPVAKLFVRPNRMQTWFEFAEQMNAALLLRGNAYAVALRDRRGDVRELIAVNPDAVTVLEASDGSIFYSVNRVGLFQISALRDLPSSIPAEDVFHLRGLAFNTTVGVGRISLARDSIGLALGQEQQAARWMANGARPSGVLQTAKSLTKDAAERLKQSWTSLFSGVQNVGATAVLEEGLEWKPLSLSAGDLQFLEQRKFSVEDVCRWFRTPPHKVGVMDGASKLNLPQADQDYVNNTIMPDLERWEQKLVRFFDLDLDGLEVDMDETALLRADIMTRINVGRLGAMSGLTAPNEWRADEKLCPIEALPKGPGWEVRAPVNTAALGSDVSGTSADGAGRPTLANQDPAA